MRSELLRLRLAFGLIGAVPVLLACWLFWVQVLQAGELEQPPRAPLRLSAETADRQGWRSLQVPAPRGTIVDRLGKPLAVDCAGFDVRLRIAFSRRAPKNPQEAAEMLAKRRVLLLEIAEDFALALVADPELPDRADELERQRERLRGILLGAWGGELAKAPRDVLVAAGVDRLAVLDALQQVGTTREVGLDFVATHQRVYPDRELTHGLVGQCVTEQVRRDGALQLVTRGISGLETFQALDPDEDAHRRYLIDGFRRPYFVAPLADPPRPSVLHTTIDIELQRIALRELRTQAEAGDPKQQPLWGALVLVDLANGDLLAAASWKRGVEHAGTAPFAPYQSLFEPGSIVKPLVLAYAHEVGVLDWTQSFDCRPGSREYRERIAALGRRRPVRDDHDCTDLDSHGILVNSSNIGAAYVGLLLEREQWRDYMSCYGFGESLDLRIPHEAVGGPHRRSFADDIPLRSFRANSAISFSFGYELQANALQIARAYLRLFTGAHAELRLCRGVELDGSFHPVPLPHDRGPRFRSEVVEAVRAALVDVVSADPHATGHHLHRRMLADSGIDLHGLIGGKTGTAATRIGRKDGTVVNARNASFVGFIPAHEPRWLAVCVLQKDDSARFYGGSYAAPPAVRMLLQARELEQRQQLREEPRGAPGGQTRSDMASPGSSGWNGASAAPGTRLGR